MAYSFPFSNATVSETKKLALYDMGELTNYGMKVDDAGYTCLTNLTASSPAFELIEYRSNDVKTVSTKVPVENQLSTGPAHKIQIEVQTVQTMVDEEGITHCEPARAYLTIIHSNAACWTDEALMTLCGRVESAAQQVGGLSRLTALSKGATKPTRE